ncbi:MAG TPA: ABC transporter permease, partial [Dehalococcoidia bacterium]|nr:ABC transporter permease [Dehalococcoidia bacterium]
IVSRLVMTLLVTLITYASGVWLFGAKMVGNAWAMFALTLLGGAIFIAAGLLQVALARSEDDIPPMFMIILMPSLLFSGAFLDRSGLPRLAALDHERPAAHLPHRRGAEGRQPRRGLRVGARRYRRPAHLGRAAYRALHLALQDGLARPAPLLH